jgi:hypothetical protein
MSTFYEPLERNRWFVDEDGARATSKRYDEKIPAILDWTDQLEGDTIAGTPTYEDRGVTRSSTSNTTTTTTTHVTGLGEFKVTVTTAAGLILQRIVRFYDASGGRMPRDYR